MRPAVTALPATGRPTFRDTPIRFPTAGSGRATGLATLLKVGLRSFGDLPLAARITGPVRLSEGFQMVGDGMRALAARSPVIVRVRIRAKAQDRIFRNKTGSPHYPVDTA